MSQRKAVVLLSGGLDSATALADAKAARFDTYALTIHYGQRHSVEIDAARKVANSMGVIRHVEQSLDLRAFGGSALTDSSLEVPNDRRSEDMTAGIPITYVPARNTIFLSLALAWAETLGAFDIFIGANCVDYSGYPDCRPDFFQAFESLANLATKAGVEGTGAFHIHAPLLMLTKEQIIEHGLTLGVDYGLTHSCYDPKENGVSCGHCDSCYIRLAAFEKVGVKDPITYAATTT